MSYASRADYEVCRKLHRQYGTTYYYASKLFEPKIRKRVHAIYGFVRVPDEWVDNPGPLSPAEVRSQLAKWRESMVNGVESGVSPEHPAMRAFCDVVLDCGIPLSEGHLFIDAMAMDIDVARYDTYADLENYMRGSAAAVGAMMTYAVGAVPDATNLESAMRLGNAMQLTNFLRDVSEDADRGRIYLPLEDLKKFGVSEEAVLAKRFTPEFRAFMQFEVERARRLYDSSHAGIRRLEGQAQSAVLLARILYARILDRIEKLDHNVFAARARTSKLEKFSALAQVLTRRPTVLEGLESASRMV